MRLSLEPVSVFLYNDMDVSNGEQVKAYEFFEHLTYLV